MILKLMTMVWLAFTGTVAWAQLQFVPVTPCRVVDTRNPAGTFGGPTMAAGASRFGHITYSDGSTAAITAWTLAD